MGSKHVWRMAWVRMEYPSIRMVVHTDHGQCGMCAGRCRLFEHAEEASARDATYLIKAGQMVVTVKRAEDKLATKEVSGDEMR